MSTSILTFSVLVIVVHISPHSRYSFDAATLFPVLNATGILTTPVFTIGQQAQRTLSAWASLKRLDEYLMRDEI